ncbi:MAG: Na+/H+ antiporter subunit E [Acidaminobacteraceae bacterium]
MRKFYNKITMFVSLFLFWIILSGEISRRQLILGSISSLIVIIISDILLNKSRSSRVKVQKVYKIIWFSCLVAVEIFKAAYEHIIRVFNGSELPRVIRVKLDVKDEFSIAMISNAITLTPGTVTVEVSYNRLTIIGFAKNEKEIADIKNTILNVYQKPFL